MHSRATLAALLVLRDHLSGFGTTAETHERVDALLRPLRRKRADGLLLPALRLGERIAELERMVDDD
jgi:hypothetical protein